MNICWRIPPSILKHLENVPSDRAVAVLLRHSVRGDLPPDESGDWVPITSTGRELACEFGALLQGRLRSLHSSPVLRCMQTAETIRDGASTCMPVMADRCLGDPSAFVLDGKLAWSNWERLGHEGVMSHLVTEDEALPGMAKPEAAARFLVHHMLAATQGEPGIHVFVTHDSMITATVARIINQALGPNMWPWYLEGAFFWQDTAGTNVAYREYEFCRPGSLCGFADDDVIEFARREIAATVGPNCEARFFLAGGAFKTLLSGQAPKDLDLWAPSKDDREKLIQRLRERGAAPMVPRPFSDAFGLAGRIIEVPHKCKPTTLSDRLGRFDIGLSAIGVEYLPDGQWSSLIHPLAIKSIVQRQVLLLKPLVNWKYALATLRRMRRYAHELGFTVPPEEESEVWRIFDAQSDEMKAGMVERYQRTGTDDFGVIEEVACRYNDVGNHWGKLNDKK